MNNLTPFLSLFFLISIVSCSADKQHETAPGTGSPQAAADSTQYAENAKAVTPVLTGTQIPNPSLRTPEGEEIPLMNLVSQQPTILIFYRGGWCPYCSKHMAELQQVESQLVEMGYQILAISPDRPEYLKESINEQDLSYSLLSDSPMTASSAFGLAYKVDQQTVDRYKNNGLDLAERSGFDQYVLPVPAVFLVDTEGLIHFQYVNPDYTTRINSRVLVTAAEEYYPEKN